MSYNSLLLEEGINAQYLAVLKPCQKITSWTVHSGSVYRASFTFGYVSRVEIDGVPLTVGSSTSLSAGQFFWDNDGQILYARASDSGNLNSKFVVAVYEIYVATTDAHWYRDPLDETTTQVYFEPIIAKVPQIKSTVRDIAFGVFPVQSTSIILNNAEKILNKHLSNGSFKNRDIAVYHWLDDLEVENIKLVMRGKMDQLSWDDAQLSIKLFDSVDVFDKEFRNPSGNSFYSSSDYSALDPNFEGKPIRYVYGIVDGFVPVNADYKSDEPGVGDNRTWKICQNGAGAFEKTGTVPSSPASTTTRTYVDSAVGFSVGDIVRINKATDESRIVTAVNYGANPYIEHDALSSGAASNGDTVIRSPVARVDIIHQGVKYTALYGRDYLTSVDANDVLTMDFETSLEANLSMPGILSPTDTVYCRVYGKTNDVTLGGGAYGSNDASGGNLQALAPILLDILKDNAGLAETEINTSSFTTLLTDSPDRLGFAIPSQSTEKFPKLRELLAEICQTGLVSLYQDADLKWKATRLKAITSVTGSIEEDEILDGSFSYDFDYSDLFSDVVVSFAEQEKSDNGFSTGFKLERASSDTARYLHKINKTLEVKSLHYNRDDAATLAARLAALYGDRQGVVSLDTKNRFFGNTIDDSIDVTRLSLPGFEYDEDTERTVELTIKQTDKSLRRVRLTLNDLKGVNENSGEF